MANSTIKQHEPSLFVAEMAPYKKPNSMVSRVLWQWRLWFEATFVFTLLEPWEKAFLMTLLAVFTTMLVTGLYKYFPYHVAFLYRRGMYYLLGQEGTEWATVQRAAETLKSSVGNHLEF